MERRYEGFPLTRLLQRCTLEGLRVTCGARSQKSRSAHALREDDVEGVDEARNVKEKREDAVDPEVCAAPFLRGY